MSYRWYLYRKETSYLVHVHLSLLTRKKFGISKLLIWITQFTGKKFQGSQIMALYLGFFTWNTKSFEVLYWEGDIFRLSMMQHCQMLLMIGSHKKWMVGCTYCILLQGECSTEIFLIATTKLSQWKKPIKVLKATSADFLKTSIPLISGQW